MLWESCQKSRAAWASKCRCSQGFLHQDSDFTLPSHISAPCPDLLSALAAVVGEHHDLCWPNPLPDWRQLWARGVRSRAMKAGGAMAALSLLSPPSAFISCRNNAQNESRDGSGDGRERWQCSLCVLVLLYARFGEISHSGSITAEIKPCVV